MLKHNDKFKRLKDKDIPQLSEIGNVKELFLYNYSLNPMTNLYRYMPLEAFVDMMRTGQNTLTSSCIQEDKFEGGVLALRYSMDKDMANDLRQYGINGITQNVNGTNIFHPQRSSWQNIYMQSWSRKENCEGMWKTYSHDGKARTVKIKCRAVDLIYSLRQCAGNENVAKCCIGAVEYMPLKKYIKLMKEINANGLAVLSSSIEEDLGKEFQIKRDDFKYEQEVRLLYLHYLAKESEPISKNIIIDEGKTLKYSVIDSETGICTLPIKEVVLDPWTKEYYMDTIIDMLSKYGIPPNRVKRSTYLDEEPVAHFF